MSKKGGGGGADTSGLEKATAEATALQKQIYEQTRGDVQPWYEMGVGSVNLLSDLLGISGGSVKSRDSIYNELLPQYQTTTQAPQGSLYTAPDGKVYSKEGILNYVAQNKIPGVNSHDAVLNNDIETLKGVGITTTGGESSTNTNYDALNAAVDGRMADQSQTPENYGELLKKFSMEDFEADPGYQFRQQEANKALERQMAAQGATLGGGGYGTINPQAYRGMQELNQGLASQEYGASRGRFIEDQLNTFNMLMGSAGMGQGATGIQASAGQSYATNTGNLQTGLASAQLNAQMAQQAKPSMFSQLLGTGTQLASAYLMKSDIKVKTNITPFGTENGYSTYKFAYKENPDQYYIGVMAQDVEKTTPEAVKEIDGIKHVNYAMIGVKMRAA